MRAASPSGYATVWTILVLLGTANMAGYSFDLYRQFWWFDRVLHCCTIFAITLWLSIIVFGRALRAEPSCQVLVFLLLASVGVAIGALWEVAEWGFDQIAAGDVIKGKYDSILDIIMDTLGAALASFAALQLLRAREAADPDSDAKPSQ
jgi:uncharacterized membrane protein YjdF